MAATAVVTLAHRPSFAPPFVVLQQPRAVHQVGGQLGTDDMTARELGVAGGRDRGAYHQKDARLQRQHHGIFAGPCVASTILLRSTNTYPCAYVASTLFYPYVRIIVGVGGGGAWGGEYAIPPSTEAPSTEGYKKIACAAISVSSCCVSSSSKKQKSQTTVHICTS